MDQKMIIRPITRRQQPDFQTNMVKSVTRGVANSGLMTSDDTMTNVDNKSKSIRNNFNFSQLWNFITYVYIA